MTTERSGGRSAGAAGRETGRKEGVGARAGRGGDARCMGFLPSILAGWSCLAGEYSRTGRARASPIGGGVLLARGGGGAQNEARRPPSDMKGPRECRPT